MFTWPEALIEEIAGQRCIFFLGAGASASCESRDIVGKRPPDWAGFLNQCVSSLSESKDVDEATQMIKDKRFLDAAEIICESIDPATFNRIIVAEFQACNYAPSKIHEHIHAIDPKILITTNYDLIYEDQCKLEILKGSYAVKHYNANGILNEVRSSRRIIVKAHGSANEPENIILSRGQYYKAKQKHWQFYQILDALFMTNTVLFVGCGLSDPDILLTLENSSIAFESLNPHYAIVQEGTHPALKRSLRNNYNIHLLEYEYGQHQKVIDALEILSTEVATYRQEEIM